MRRKTALTTLLAFLAPIVLHVVGCDRKAPPPPPIDKTAIVGVWQEIAPAEYGNVRIPAGDAMQFYRHIEIGDDGTFQFQLVKESGAAYKSAKISGTWDVDAQSQKIAFTVEKNDFDSSDEAHGWAPASCGAVRSENLGKQGAVDQITVNDSTGMPTSYKRVK